MLLATPRAPSSTGLYADAAAFMVVVVDAADTNVANRVVVAPCLAMSLLRSCSMLSAI
jgi:hypothetical protein